MARPKSKEKRNLRNLVMLLIKIEYFFWGGGVTSCHWASISWRFDRSRCLHRQGSAVCVLQERTRILNWGEMTSCHWASISLRFDRSWCLHRPCYLCSSGAHQNFALGRGKWRIFIGRAFHDVSIDFGASIVRVLRSVFYRSAPEFCIGGVVAELKAL